MSRIELVIFDFDGTLVDTAPDLIRAANFYFESEGLEPLPEQVIRNEIGMGLRKLIWSLHPSKDLSDEQKNRIEADFLKIYERELLHGPRLFDGAMEFLAEWDAQVAIVSNKRVRFIHPILKHLGLEGIPWTSVIGGDTYPNMKPHPEPFLGALAAAGVTPEQTLIVGDGAPDVLGAQSIGSRCVAVEFGYAPIDELMDLGAFAKIERFSDLLPLIQEIG